MAVLNSDHLLDQADALVSSRSYGPPRQVDLRRAVSASYYALFHVLLTAAADEMIGAVHQSSGRYRLVYRSIDHRTIAAICSEVRKTPLAAKFAVYVPRGLFQGDIKRFAGMFRELQQRRHQADYDPGLRFKSVDAKIAIRLAREAIALFRGASDPERKVFLAMLVCPPR